MDVLGVEAGILSGQVVSILGLIVFLGLVIFVHELGHFLAAKWAGIKVEEFALGLGKRLAGFRRGETEYRLNILPFGGYVKMLGQDDFDPLHAEQADPRSWQRTTVGKRLVVLSAGVVMNVVFAVLVFVLVYLVGIRFVAPVVGGVSPGFPAAEVELPAEVAAAMGRKRAVGLMPGDRILAINGREIRKFDEIFEAAALSSAGERFRLLVSREVNGRKLTFEVTLVPKRMERGPGGPRYAFGIAPALDAVIAEPAAVGYVGTERFRPGDKILAVGGREIHRAWEIDSALENLDAPVVKVLVQRGGRRVTVPLRAYLFNRTQPHPPAGDAQWRAQEDAELLTLLGLSPRVEVAQVAKGSPADKAGLEPGDVIVRYGDVSDPSRARLMAISRQLKGTPAPMTVLRAGRKVHLTVTPTNHEGEVLIGIHALPDEAHLVVGAVRPDSPADAAGIVPGVVLRKVNGTAVETWSDVYRALQAADGRTVTVTYALGTEQETARIGPLTREMFDPQAYEFGFPALGYSTRERLKTGRVQTFNPLRALSWSFRDTWSRIVNTYRMLWSLGRGDVNPRQVHGPIGIGAAAIAIGRQDGMMLVYFMSMLSVIVAVINFLPLPVLDGGHVVLVLIEKVRGRPLPLKVVAAVQIVGWVLILGVFVAVTWNDFQRIFSGW